MSTATIALLEGGAALCAWLGTTPSFHDATLRELELRQGALSRIVVSTFRMTSELDAQGYFVLANHVVVTLTIYELIDVALSGFAEAAILDFLDIDIDEQGTILEFDSNYGVAGRIKAKRVTVSFDPD